MVSPPCGHYSSTVLPIEVYTVNQVQKVVLSLLLFHLYLMVFLVPLFLLPGVRVEQPAILYKELLIRILSASFITMIIAWMVLYRIPHPGRLTLTNLGIVVFIGAIVASAFSSGNLSYTLKEAHLFLLLLVVALLVPLVIRRWEDAFRIRQLIIITALLVGAYGLLQYLNLDFLYSVFPFVSKGKESRYIFSTIGNPEYLGSYIAAISVMMVPALLAGSYRRMTYWLRMAGFLFLLFIILLTGARGAFLGLFIGSIFILAITLKTRRLVLRRVHYISLAALILIFVAIVIVFSFPNPINVRNADVLGRFSNLVNIRDDSIKERILFNSVSVEMIFDRPILGRGAGMFKVDFYTYIQRLVAADPRAGMVMTLADLKNRVPDNAHNDLLQFWVEFGGIGVFAFLLAVVSLFAASLRNLTNPAIPEKFYVLHLSVLALLLVLVINALVSFPFHVPTRATVFWVFWGVCTALLKIEGNLVSDGSKENNTDKEQ